MKTRFDRRKVLQMMMGSPFLTSCLKAQNTQMSGAAQDAVSGPKKFLFVFTAMGGASINDCFLARRASEVKDAATLNVFPDLLVKSIDGTDLRAVDMASDAIGALPFPVKAVQSRFLNKYKNDIMVATCTGTAVAHPVAQKRSVTGYDAWNGRTLQEAVAAQYGRGMLLPNINMATVGYAEHGRDRTLPSFAVAEPVPDPAFFPFSLHGYKGLQGVPDDALIAMARQLRDQKLEPQSGFYQTFGASPLLQDWMKYRARQSVFEKSDAINKLNPFADSKDLPFKNFGLDPNRDGEVLREVFPDIGPDPLQTQALLAYLSVTQGLTCTATFGLGMNVTIDGKDEDNPLLTNTPTAFDYSHNAHRSTQAVLWHRILDTLDRLITLLKVTEYQNGESYWDHSMIYIATEFGRDKTRRENLREFPTGHDVNNGVVIISPLVNGGRVLGGVDNKTLNTYGFDPETGDPEPGREMNEKEIYAGILHALGVDTSGSGLPSMRAMRRKG
jgi:hypothetical protein